LHYYIVPGVFFKLSFCQFSKFASNLSKPLKVIKILRARYQASRKFNQTIPNKLDSNTGLRTQQEITVLKLSISGAGLKLKS
jgi:hypothetical protein